MQPLLIYIFPCLTFLRVGGSDSSTGDLQFVAVVFRHGDRAPFRPYPKDPYHSESSCWPNGWSQLTNLGKLQQFELGKWLRDRYCKFLPTDYHPGDIHVVSTDTDRTLISAYSNLAGLYESWMRENKVRDLDWVGIPVHTVPLHMDEVVAAKRPCLEYDRLVEEAMKSEEVESANEYYEEAMRALSEHTGAEVETVMDAPLLYGTLNAESLHGFQLPQWTKAFFPEPLKEMSEFALRVPTLTQRMRRLKCGPLLKDILDRMREKRCGAISQRLWMYSGHDTTVANLMRCMDVYDGVLPPYTATLLFELFKRGSEYWIVVSYRTATTFRVLRVPQCERLCPLNTFRRLVNDVLPEDWEKECRRQDNL